MSTSIQVTESAVRQTLTVRKVLAECFKVLVVDVSCVADVTDISYSSRITH